MENRTGQILKAHNNCTGSVYGYFGENLDTAAVKRDYDNPYLKSKNVLKPSLKPDNYRVPKLSSDGTLFSFNPRKEESMSFHEKIQNWIISVPLTQVDNSIFMGTYPTVVELTNEEHAIPTTENVDFADDKDIIDFQSRMITFYATLSYINDPSEKIFDRKTQHSQLSFDDFDIAEFQYLTEKSDNDLDILY